MLEERGSFAREGHQGAEFKIPTFVSSTRALKDRDGCQNSGITFLVVKEEKKKKKKEDTILNILKMQVQSTLPAEIPVPNLQCSCL